jgi:hypothetical protein
MEQCEGNYITFALFKVVNSVPFRTEWSQHSISIQKTEQTEQISSHFKSRSVPDFLLNSTRNIPVSFHMFRSALEKSLNQIEPCSI